jgi:two-component system response regulator MprA
MPKNGVYRILIIDDNAAVIKLIQLNLSRKPQFSTLLAYDAEDGIALVGLEKPDLVLLDINLPRMNGLTACKQIKATSPTMPIIIITGELDPTLRFQAYDAGADDFLTKPFSPDQLITHIRYHLHLSSLDL